MKKLSAFAAFCISASVFSAPAQAQAVAREFWPQNGGRQLHVTNTSPFVLTCRILEANGSWFIGNLAPGMTIWKWVHPANAVQWNCWAA